MVLRIAGLYALFGGEGSPGCADLWLSFGPAGWFPGDEAKQLPLIMVEGERLEKRPQQVFR